MKFFAKCALSLLNSVFHMEDDYTVASFLHPKFKELLSVTPAQKSECYCACTFLYYHINFGIMLFFCALIFL